MTTEILTTPGSDLGEVIITRDFNAPREVIWNAFFDPAQLAKFWGPIGTHTPLESVVLEPWVGGRFETLMVADDGSGEFPSKAKFTEINEPESFAFAEAEEGLSMVTTSTFTDLGDGRTRMVIHQRNVPEMYRTPEALAGFNTSLDRFEQYLATLKA
jgi:uncharacterized protein YndB with AHSA1/START domain